MTSLTKLCYKTIAQNIEDAPPMIQEMIVKNTSKHMEKNALKRALPKAIKKTEKKFGEILPDLISEMICDIMRLMTSSSDQTPDYYSKYPNISKHIIKCAITTAEETARILDNLESTAFRLYGQQSCDCQSTDYDY
uniref:Uncharacterized protein n=1 Tax=viral metagenome TaxID=1070528 RepID=A0A6C0LZC4_9ZZZZ